MQEVRECAGGGPLDGMTLRSNKPMIARFAAHNDSAVRRIQCYEWNEWRKLYVYCGEALLRRGDNEVISGYDDEEPWKQS